MTFIQIYLIAVLVTLGLMIALWLLSLLLKNSSIGDIFWGTGFVILAWVYFALTPSGFMTRKLLLTILTTLWGLRLSLYILYRNWGKPEGFLKPANVLVFPQLYCSKCQKIFKPC
jgi:steroid 5-alpha reductase family enzyme